jgi:dolichol-phosphate mannosyltransferase
MQIARSRKSHATNAAQPFLRLAQPSIEVSVIVPTLNEAANLPKLLQLISDALARRSFEIVIVDDNSRDNTQEVCQNLGEQYPLRLINRPTPRNGLSGAVIRGLEAARGEFLVVMDADLQHPADKIPALLDELQSDRADMAIGSRYIQGGDTEKNWSLWRKLNSRVATFLSKPVACGTHDPMSGFFALRSSTFQQARQLSPTGYKIALELLCKCRVNRIAEVPIHFGRRQLGQSKLSARQQWRFLVHLSRLYQFKYPKSIFAAKTIASTLLGVGFAAAMVPVMWPFFALWTPVAVGYATRSNRPLTPGWTTTKADQEIPLRAATTPPIELAA